MIRRIFLAVMFGTFVAGANALAADPNPIVSGTWVNTDSASRGTVKLAIAISGNTGSIQAWGSCTPTPCDWGRVNLNLVGDSVGAKTYPYGFAQWDKEISMHYMTLRREGSELVIEVFTIYKNKSARSDYRTTDRFKLAAN